MKLNNNPLVSVIIPTYKRAIMLERALKSVFNQTYNNIEIIIVDDNDEKSKYREETLTFMKKYERIPKLKYIQHVKNKGGSAARNTGIDAAKGTYVTFLDDDDEYSPTKIEFQVKRFLESDLEKLGFVYCQIETYDESNQLIGKSRNFYKGNKIPFEVNMVKTIAGTPTIMVLRSVLQEINGFKDLKSGQDWFLTLEILNQGYQCDYLNESLVKVHDHSEKRITNSTQKLNSLIERFDLKSKYFNKLSKKTRKLVTYKHNMQIANYLKYNDKKTSIKYFLKALNYKKISWDNLTFIITFILGRKVVSRIKRAVV